MINLVVGKQGSGKTKKIIDYLNKTIKDSAGNIVIIDYGNNITYGLNYNVRLINIKDYNINNFDELYGFINGLCASNYDLTDILIDSICAETEIDIDKLLLFMNKLNYIDRNNVINLTISISMDENKLPDELKKFTSFI